MVISLELLALLCLSVLPYLTFVFFGECLNPLVKPVSPAVRLRWKYGKSMALTMLLAMVFANILIFLVAILPMLAYAIGGAIFIVVGIYLHLRRAAFINTMA